MQVSRRSARRVTTIPLIDEASLIILLLLATETNEPSPCFAFNAGDSDTLQVLSCISKLKLRHFRAVVRCYRYRGSYLGWVTSAPQSEIVSARLKFSQGRVEWGTLGDVKRTVVEGLPRTFGTRFGRSSDRPRVSANLDIACSHRPGS
jgi:hypothetical protein